MEFLAEVISYALTEVVFGYLFYAIGWICLFIWYRDRKKMQKYVNEKYGGQYNVAAGVFILNLIAGAGAIALIGLWILVVGSFIYKAVVN